MICDQNVIISLAYDTIEQEHSDLPKGLNNFGMTVACVNYMNGGLHSLRIDEEFFSCGILPHIGGVNSYNNILHRKEKVCLYQE